MTAFSPVDAAFEGLRVMRREPRAVLAWIAVWALVLAVFGIVSFVLRHTATPAAHSGSFASDALKACAVPLKAPVMVVGMPAWRSAAIRNLHDPCTGHELEELTGEMTASACFFRSVITPSLR